MYDYTYFSSWIILKKGRERERYKETQSERGIEIEKKETETRDEEKVYVRETDR